MIHLSPDSNPAVQRAVPTAIVLEATPPAGIVDTSGIGAWVNRLGQLDLFTEAADEADTNVDTNVDTDEQQEAHPLCWAVPGAFTVCETPDDHADGFAG